MTSRSTRRGIVGLVLLLLAGVAVKYADLSGWGRAPQNRAAKARVAPAVAAPVEVAAVKHAPQVDEVIKLDNPVAPVKPAPQEEEAVAARANDGSVTVQLPKERARAGAVAVERGANGEEYVQVLVELSEAPTFQIHLDAKNMPGLSAEQSKVAATHSVRGQSEKIGKSQDALVAAVTAMNGRVIYRVSRVMNAVAIAVPKSAVAAVRELPGVKSVRKLELEYPMGGTAGNTAGPDNAGATQFVGGPQAWQSMGGLTGTGIKIGVIDTGIDYQHPNFGGTGLLADYQANDRTVITDMINGQVSFPTAKVAGGVDLVGDNYTGDNAPVPDPDPMDRGGHGTHVAGSAAGLGVTAAGVTYPGPYTTEASAAFNALRIGPGMAPGAKLYAIRVFGTTGGTNLTIAGIDWAIDPNNDGDFSDRMDVLNLSLGSNYGEVTHSTTVAAENAGALGIVTVISAGNAGDTYFITGSPGSAQRVLTVASTADSRVLTYAVQVTEPALIAGSYSAVGNNFGSGAPLPSGQTGQVVQALDAADAAGMLTTDCCSAVTNAGALAGKIAFVDRGTCGFQVKAANAQAAGAIGVIVANSLQVPMLTMVTTAGQPAITIPVVAISKADGDLIRAQIATGVTVTLPALAAGGDSLSSFSSRGARIGAPARLKPDIGAPGQNIVSSQTGVVGTSGSIVTDPTGFKAGGQSLTISGTSMAAPCAAGLMCLLKQKHPDWSFEELKALAMNTATHDITVGGSGVGLKYGVGRVGAGRIDAVQAATADVIAFNAEDAGAVSVSFGDVEVSGVTTRTKTVRVVNHGSTDANLELAIALTTTVPGVTMTLPGGNALTVPAHQSRVVTILLSADPAAMKHSIDLTVAKQQVAAGALAFVGTVDRHWLSEVGGYLTLSQSGTLKARVPVYAQAHPSSTMAGAAAIDTGGQTMGNGTIALSGGGVDTGALAPIDVRSAVSPFEMQAASARNAAIEAHFDIQYVGVAYDAVTNQILFGVSTWGNWNTPGQVAFNVYIDVDSNGTFERILFNSDAGQMGRNLFGDSISGQDGFITAVFNLSASTINVAGGNLKYVNANPSLLNSALFNSNVMVLAATPAQLGLAVGTTSFRYKVETQPGFDQLGSELSGSAPFDSATGLAWNYGAQGLNYSGARVINSQPGGTIPVSFNTTNLATNGSLGALLLHHHNTSGTRAQFIPIDTGPRVDLAVTQSASSTTPVINQNVTLTLSASNTGAFAASGVSVVDVLPAGLTYVSDNGAGAYVPGTGRWTIGSLALDGTASLQIVAKVTTDAQIRNSAVISGTTPVDANLGNNISNLNLNPLVEADLNVTIVANPLNAAINTPIEYSVTLTNAGPSMAFNVAVNHTAAPAGVLSSAVVSDGVFEAAAGSWKIGSVPSGAVKTLKFKGIKNSSASQTVTAVAASDANDNNPANNTRSAATTLAAPVIVLSGAPTSPLTVAYALTLGAVTNEGPVPVKSYVVKWGDGSSETFSTAGVKSHVYAAASTPMITVDLIYEVATFLNAGSLAITVTPSPVSLSSGPTATPVVAFAGQAVAFAVSAADSGGGTLAYAWDFADGSTAAEQNPSHSFGAPGIYVVKLKVSSSIAGSVEGSVSVIVTPVAVLGGGKLDTDGDGFSDEFETKTGTLPGDAGSTPFGGSKLNAAAVGALTLEKPMITLNFAKAGGDSIKFGGTVAIPAGFKVTGSSVHVLVGEVLKSFTLDAKGMKKSGGDTFKLTIKSKKGVVAAQAAKYGVSLSKGSFVSGLAASGLTGEKEIKKAEPRTVSVSVFINAGLLQKTQGLMYTAKKGKSGKGK